MNTIYNIVAWLLVAGVIIAGILAIYYIGKAFIFIASYDYCQIWYDMECLPF